MSVVRYVSAYGGLAIIAYYTYGVIVAKHLSVPYKIGIVTVIAAIALAGARAILEYENDGERLYTAAEVAELLEAVRAERLGR